MKASGIQLRVICLSLGLVLTSGALSSALPQRHLDKRVATTILQSNDDGWAVANVRALNTALNQAGYDVVLSCPAQNQSGTGSLSTTPSVLTKPCEYDTCPVGSPAEGFNESDTRLNYVNAYPVDATRYGIQTLSPQFFGGTPQLMVSGPNVGSNLGISTLFSGTIGAACEASKSGIPSIAFSGSSGSQVSYTTLSSDPTSANTFSAQLYSALSVKFIQALLSSSSPSSPLLPANTSLNVNFPASTSTSCSSPSDFKFVISRIYWNIFVEDINVCGSNHLPTESDVVGTSGCYASVSVFDANSKLDAGIEEQQAVYDKLQGILTCLP